MRGNPSALKTTTSSQLNSTPLNSTPQSDIALLNVVYGLLAIALPLVLVCTIVGYRKYRAALLQWKIQRLKHIWQLDSSKKLS